MSISLPLAEVYLLTRFLHWHIHELLVHDVPDIKLLDCEK